MTWQTQSNNAFGSIAIINLRSKDPDSHQVTEIRNELTTSQLGTTFDAMPRAKG